MPELPEVETVARDLRPLVVGKTILRAWWSGKKLRLPWQQGWTSRVKGWTFLDVKRRAKWLVFYLGKDDESCVGEKDSRCPKLIAHLGMTGQLTFSPGGDSVFDTFLPQDHIHLRFELARTQNLAGRVMPKKGGGSSETGALRFRDVRRFGGFYLAGNQDELEAFFEKHRLGPEPWDCPLQDWKKSLSKTSRAIKAVLLDQAVISGVGNIYADECLHAAGIHPCRQSHSLNQSEASRLLKQAARVMVRAIENRGSTIRDYVGGENLNGRNQDFLRVYGREGQPCLTCGTALSRWVVGGRSSHFCPQCQPAPRFISDPPNASGGRR